MQRLALFGPPPLLEGEDAAAYDQLVARIYAAINPTDIIDEILILKSDEFSSAFLMPFSFEGGRRPTVL